MTSSQFSRALGAAAFVAMTLAWLIPNHFPPWTSFYNDSAMALALVLLAGAHAATIARSPVPLFAWVAVGVACIPWLQWLGGLVLYSGDAIVSSLYLLGVAVSVSVGFASARFDQTRVPTLVATAALCASVVSAVFAVTQALGFSWWGIWAEPSSRGLRAPGNLAQPNNFATLLALGVLGLVYLRERDRISRWAGAALVVLLVAAAALTQSRISLAFGPVVVLGLLWARRQRIRVRLSVGVALAVVALHWCLSWGWPVLQHALYGDGPLSFGQRGLFSYRYGVWNLLFRALNDSPWIGYGWQQVGASEYDAAGLSPPVKELWLNAHNLFLELLLWCGYPLGLLIGGALVAWFVSRVRRLTSLEALVGMLVVAVVGLHAMIELPYVYAYFLIPIGLWIGVVESTIDARTATSGRWMLAPSLVAIVLLGGVWVNYPAVEEDFRLVRFENLRIGNLRATEPAPHAPFLSGLTGFLRFSRAPLDRDMTSEELAALEASVRRYPYAASILRYTMALALNGRSEEARSAFTKIRHLYGDHTYARLRVDLRQRMTEIDPALASFENSLPD